ncbi:MAG: ABC transporter ATP-binding protein [Candidatus Wallbacteria bacterium]|nr:ABC transporter ATP-binding protein [Candidatus Wallbacteria bacterium]
MGIIEAEGLVKQFGSFTAVDSVSFTVHTGEVVAILGANGAGKTTTMRMLTGYFQPTAGTVQIAGHDILKDAFRAQEKIGYLPETPPLYPEMTVSAFLEFVARLRGAARGQARVLAANAMERCQLSDRKDWVIGQMSRGYRQRVGLAQAIVTEPQVLILDEPTAGLDPEQILMVRSLIVELARDRTVLFSTHVLAEAEKVCSRAIILKQGKIVADETIPSLLDSRGQVDQVQLEVHGPREDVVRTLHAVPGVKDVTIAPEPADGAARKVPRPPIDSLRLEVAAYRSPTLVNELSAAVTRGGWPVDRIGYRRKSLEEVYLKLVASSE